MQRSDIERRLRDFFEHDSHGAAAVYLFGSLARDAAGPTSDIDVGVLYQRKPPSTPSSERQFLILNPEFVILEPHRSAR